MSRVVVVVVFVAVLSGCGTSLSPQGGCPPSDLEGWWDAESSPALAEKGGYSFHFNSCGELDRMIMNARKPETGESATLDFDYSRRTATITARLTDGSAGPVVLEDDPRVLTQGVYAETSRDADQIAAQLWLDIPGYVQEAVGAERWDMGGWGFVLSEGGTTLSVRPRFPTQPADFASLNEWFDHDWPDANLPFHRRP